MQTPLRVVSIDLPKGLKKIKVDKLESGDIIAVAGIENINIGDTISSNENPKGFNNVLISYWHYALKTAKFQKNESLQHPD